MTCTMQKRRGRGFPIYYGLGEIRVSRYLVLYVAQIGWLALGWYLYHHALWPSSCQPKDFIRAYTCSLQLPETGKWAEAATFIWLWATPMLVALEISRRLQKKPE